MQSTRTQVVREVRTGETTYAKYFIKFRNVNNISAKKRRKKEEKN